MRAGYDRVYSDTVRPPIPDVPVREPVEAKNERETTSALIVVSAVLGFLLILAVAEGVYMSAKARVASVDVGISQHR